MPTSSAPLPRWRLLFAYFALYIVWGSAYSAIHIAIETTPPFLMAGLRFALAGGVLYLWVRSRGEPAPVRAHWRSAIIAGLILFIGNNGLLVWSASQSVPGGIQSLIVASVPMWMVLLTWLRPGGKRPGALVFAGLLIGFAGIALLIDPAQIASIQVAPGDNLLLGIAAMIFAAFCWSVGSLYTRQAHLPSSPLLSTAMQLLTGGVMLIGLSILTGEAAGFDLAQVSPASAAAIVYLAVFPSLIGFTSYIWLLRVQPPSRVATYAYVNPIVALILGLIFQGEPLTARTLVAAAVIIGAVMLINNARHEGDAETAAPRWQAWLHLPRLRPVKPAVHQ